MRYQPVYRTGNRSRTQARRLIAASQRIDPRVAAQMLYDSELEQSVKRCKAQTPMIVGKVVLLPGDHYYKVESGKFKGYYYVVAQHRQSKTWQFSGDKELASKYIGKAKEHLAELWKLKRALAAA
jgi:hypothetical protein